jgi:HEAT repeat protein
MEPPAMSESSPGSTATANIPWWESTTTGTPVLLAFLKLDRAGSTREWQELSEDEVFRRRAQYVTGVEYVADKLGAAQPLHWQGDGVMLFFRGDELKSAVTRAFEAAEAIRERIIVDLSMQVRLAVHAAVVSWNPDTGKLAHPAIDLCGHLEHATPVNGIAVTEDVYLALAEAQKQRAAPLGVTTRDGVAAYVLPASLAARKDPQAFRPGEELRIRDNFRRYVGSPEIRRLRYVGFPLQKKQPPSLDLLEVFIAPEARVRAHQGPDWSQAARMLGAGIGLSGDLLETRAQLKQVEAHLPPEPISKLVARHRSLVVLGDPGSGKTTVLRWLAAVAVGGPLAWAEQFGVTERLLPLMVSVGRLAEIRSRLGSVCSVSDALAVYFHDRNVGGEVELKGFLERGLESGEFLVLLDGLDEVRSEARDGVLRWLETFCARFPRNRFVVSARLVGYSGCSLPEGVEVELGPFSDEQIRRYVLAFERACRRWENNGIADDVGANREAENLLEALFENPRLRDLARNPFLLSALALIHRAEGRLPRHRVQAYEIFARTLCETWSQARRIVAGEGATRDIRYEEEAIPILGELALRMHEEWPTGVAPEEFVVRTLAEAIQERNAVPRREAEQAAKEFLERAGKEVQILLERGTGQWGFLHLTFQEFFTAVGLLSSERFESVALQHLFDPRWEEVLRLGVGYMALIQKRAQATQRIIKGVLTHEASGGQRFLTEVLQKQVYLAALLASEAGDVLPPPLQEEIARAVVEWSGFMPESAVVSLLHELSLTDFAERLRDALLAELQSEDERTRARAVLALGPIGGERAQQALLGAVRDSSSLVRSRVCMALSTQKAPLNWDALATLARDPEPYVRVAALGEVLSTNIKSKLSEFIAAVADDPRPEVVSTLFSALLGSSLIDRAHGQKLPERIQPEVFIQVLHKGLRHEDEGIRAQAQVLMVAQGGVRQDIADPKTGPRAKLLLQFFDRLSYALDSDDSDAMKLLEGQDDSARELAITILGRSKDGRVIRDERIMAALIKATKDPVPRIRAAALATLGQLRVAEAEKVMVRSLRDPDPGVRVSAIQGLDALEAAAAVRPLSQIVQKTSNPDERREALTVLWKLSAKAPADAPRKRASSKKPGTKGRTSGSTARSRKPIVKKRK